MYAIIIIHIDNTGQIIFLGCQTVTLQFVWKIVFWLYLVIGRKMFISDKHKSVNKKIVHPLLKVYWHFRFLTLAV